MRVAGKPRWGWARTTRKWCDGYKRRIRQKRLGDAMVRCLMTPKIKWFSLEPRP